jgi:hypothetical protein
MNSENLNRGLIEGSPLVAVPTAANGKTILPNDANENDNYEAVPARRTIALSVCLRIRGRGIPAKYPDFSVEDEE